MNVIIQSKSIALVWLLIGADANQFKFRLVLILLERRSKLNCLAIVKINVRQWRDWRQWGLWPRIGIIHRWLSDWLIDSLLCVYSLTQATVAVTQTHENLPIMLFVRLEVAVTKSVANSSQPVWLAVLPRMSVICLSCVQAHPRRVRTMCSLEMEYFVTIEKFVFSFDVNFSLSWLPDTVGILFQRRLWITW